MWQKLARGIDELDTGIIRLTQSWHCLRQASFREAQYNFVASLEFFARGFDNLHEAFALLGEDIEGFNDAPMDYVVDEETGEIVPVPMNDEIPF